jgi:hypothetical protein
MKDPDKMTQPQLVEMAKGHKSMITNLQEQLRKALESNAALYAELKKQESKEVPCS